MVERDKEAKMIQKTISKTQIEPCPINEIGSYLEKIHGKKAEIIDPFLKKLELLKKLRKLLKSL